MRDRNRQKQIWSDAEFVKTLEQIKARRILAGLPPYKNIGQITKEMVKCPSFEQVAKELIEKERRYMKIKLDKKRLFK